MPLSSSPLSTEPALTDEQTLTAAVNCLSEPLDLETHGAVSRHTVFEVMLWAASRCTSIEHASQMREGVPSGNGLRYHLHKFENMASMEAQLNQALPAQVPSQITNRRQRFVI